MIEQRYGIDILHYQGLKFIAHPVFGEIERQSKMVPRRRTWKERLLTRPWRPWRRTKWVDAPPEALSSKFDFMAAVTGGYHYVSPETFCRLKGMGGADDD